MTNYIIFHGKNAAQYRMVKLIIIRSINLLEARQTKSVILHVKVVLELLDRTNLRYISIYDCNMD